MIITASYYNECSFAEKNEAHNIASVFKDDDIDIFDVYAYFFVKQRPISFDKFTRNIRKMLRVFGLSVDLI